MTKMNLTVVDSGSRLAGGLSIKPRLPSSSETGLDESYLDRAEKQGTIDSISIPTKVINQRFAHTTGICVRGGCAVLPEY